MLIFNFENAIRLSRDLFPEETSKITFVDLQDRDAQQTIENWFKSIGYTAATAEWPSIKVIIGGTRLHFNSATDKKLLCIDSPNKEQIFENRNKELFHIFLHELGHAVIPGARPDFGMNGDYSLVSTIKREMMADVFYALLGLKLGLASKDDILRLADFRAQRVWKTNGHDSEHMTSPALEATLGFIEGQDLKSYTPHDIVNAATAISTQYVPDIQELRAMRRTFSGPLSINRFLCFSCGVNKKPENTSGHEVRRLTRLFNSAHENKLTRRVAKAALETIAQKKQLRALQISGY